MQKCAAVIRNTTNFVVAFILLGFMPLIATTNSLAVADDCIAPASSTPGIHAPTGADAGTFVYQCSGQYAGLYYNGYYTYNPASGDREATYPANYSYNCSAQQWTMDEYDYSPGQGTFIKSRVTASPAPNLPTGCPPPPSTSSSGSGSNIGNTGNGSANNINNNGSIDINGSNSNTIGMSNTIDSNAMSGDAIVLNNTYAGGATSGDALTMATIINMLQSSSNVLGDNVAMFSANINGDVNGDFIFDPSATISNTGSGSQNGINNNLQINVNNSNDTNAQINNDINLSAASGDATVQGNTNAGDARSGNASAIVNLINLINSSVSAGQSFVGTININGNLNGDILLPPDFVNQLLAASGANSGNTAASNSSSNATLSNSLISDINNNVTSTATTGDAQTQGNTNAGGATSGQVSNNLTILNLTGSNVIGKNNLLVFVNVLGTWVGMIVNAPAGSTAASLGGGISSTGNGSTNSTTNATGLDATLTNNSNFGINNNVNIAAASGDATVRNNTNAGSATSGNANTGANILNMTGSNLNLSNWFGVLFINVLGNWTGSFGVNTSAGNPVQTPTSSTTTTPPQTDSSGQQFASFVAHTASATTSTGFTSEASANPVNDVLGATTPVAKKLAKDVAVTSPTPDTKTHASYVLPLIGFGVAGVLLLVGERGRLVKK
jgi:hypothetical protein